MKQIALILILCVFLSPACLAETSHAEDFMTNLSRTWDSFLGMASDAGEVVTDWANDSGIADWASGALQDISDWAEGSGLTEWANGALRDISDWVDDAGIVDWAREAAAQLKAFAEENGPAVEAWLARAGEDVRSAWDTLVDPDGHTAQEIREAFEAVVESLKDAGEELTGALK